MSKEDQNFYLSKLREFKLQFMGSSTYDSVKNRLRPAPNKLHVVFTTHPERYLNEDNGVVFTNLSPVAAIERYSALGYSTAALVGGAQLYLAFLKAELINEFFITIEPVEFSSGTLLFGTASLDALKNYTVLSEAILNSQGTKLIRYKKPSLHS